jgi:hypothetical protein
MLLNRYISKEESRTWPQGSLARVLAIRLAAALIRLWQVSFPATFDLIAMRRLAFHERMGPVTLPEQRRNTLPIPDRYSTDLPVASVRVAWQSRPPFGVDKRTIGAGIGITR